MITSDNKEIDNLQKNKCTLRTTVKSLCLIPDELAAEALPDDGPAPIRGPGNRRDLPLGARPRMRVRRNVRNQDEG